MGAQTLHDGNQMLSVHNKMTEAVENETTDDDRNKVRVASHPFSLLIWMGLVKLLGKPKEIGSS